MNDLPRASVGIRVGPFVTHIITVVVDAPSGPFSQHQHVHLRLHRTGAAQRLPAPVGGLPRVRVPEGWEQHSHSFSGGARLLKSGCMHLYL